MKKASWFVASIGVAAVAALLSSSAQSRSSIDWPLHNLDLAGSRFSTLDQINTLECQVADATMALPARCHRRRQQPDDAGHRRRRDVCDRFRAEACMRSTPPTGTCSGPTTSPISSEAAGARVTSSATAASCYARRRRLRRRRVVPVRARRQDRKADSWLRQQRPGERDSRRAQDADTRRPRPPSAWGIGSRPRRRSQRRALHRQHAKREPHPGRPRVRCRRQDGQGPLALQHGPAGREGSGLGDRRPNLGRRRTQRRRHLGDAGHRSRSWDCSTSRSGIRSATAGSGRASTSSPIRSSRSRSARAS